MTTVAILSPGYPDSLGGVTDHTCRLVANWSGSGNRVQVIGRIDQEPEILAQELHREGAEALLIQYVPFLYGRRGLSRFPEAVAGAVRDQEIRVTIFVHEPWVPPTRLPWLILSPLQKAQLRRLLAASDAVVTSVPAWREKLDCRSELIYVGSTLGELPPGTAVEPPAPPLPPLPPLPAPVVFSPMAAGLRWEWIEAAVDVINARPGLIAIGADEATLKADPRMRRWQQKNWEWQGRMPREEVLRNLARARLVLAPYVDGITGRRTSLMAALSAGARTVSSTGHLFDPFFGTAPMLTPSTKPEFVKAATSVWHAADSPQEREKRLAWYQKHLDASALDDRLLKVVIGDTR